ncbi:MAG: NDP-sugar synthase [Chlamydiales bacterium]|nr:NDP-sugar synthase [Chlamydiia bacterium]MCP5507955.1 NDP-sugar synthase [Chlamydiales bacterium]
MKIVRAIINATGLQPDLNSLLIYRPTPLLKIVDKPIIYHILEYLSVNGIRKCDIVLNHYPHLIEKRLGGGSRWGVEITYHLARDARYPYDPLLPVIEMWDREVVLLGRGDCLPVLGNQPHSHSADIPLLYFYPEKEWSGWAALSAEALREMGVGVEDEALPKHVRPNYQTEQVKHFLCVRTLQELKYSNRKSITMEHQGHFFPTTAREVEHGVWLSRAVSLHPSVKVIPPVFIGDNCYIREGAQIGPYTVIENHCIIDKMSIVEDSLVCRRSYIGEGLEIRNCIIDRNLLINMSLEAHIAVKDDFLLSELKHINFKHRSYLFLERIGAAFCFLLLLPFYLIMLATCKLRHQEVISLPASEISAHWTTFKLYSFAKRNGSAMNFFERFFQRLPLLINIINGDVHFVGVEPRTIEEVAALPESWRLLYVKSKVGIITLSNLDNGPAASEDDKYASEGYYSVTMSWWQDVKLFFRWLFKKPQSLMMGSQGGRKR